jgi:hypothetical protein
VSSQCDSNLQLSWDSLEPGKAEPKIQEGESTAMKSFAMHNQHWELLASH